MSYVLQDRYSLKLIEDLDMYDKPNLTDEPKATTWTTEGDIEICIAKCKKMLSCWPERYVCGWVYDNELECRCSHIFRNG
jgi:hypothetical protein